MRYLHPVKKRSKTDLPTMENGIMASLPILYSWNARRAGGRITIEHSCGKVVGVDRIEPAGGKVIATDKNARQYELHVA